eukprot:CAMPEP_0184293058 /NCGR_PEP_ID=MMETSP1049-20130417/4646_1 /TAXON_ID=77928 /ORGANISM="Proteomonas sulcata, Strain CCMP704" /LENGTH=592 /DNA_ID=CAMNT_0026600987 /DNA_START=33 /DNA_END=1811 /DNA_ORIENTATION=-
MYSLGERLDTTRKCALFGSKSNSCIFEIAKAIEAVSLKPKQVLCRKGKPVEAVFIVYRGIVSICQDKVEEKRRGPDIAFTTAFSSSFSAPKLLELNSKLFELGKLGSADFFGDEKWSGEDKYQYTLIADSNAVLFKIPIDTFREILKSERVRYREDGLSQDVDSDTETDADGSEEEESEIFHERDTMDTREQGSISQAWAVEQEGTAQTPRAPATPRTLGRPNTMATARSTAQISDLTDVAARPSTSSGTPSVKSRTGNTGGAGKTLEHFIRNKRRPVPGLSEMLSTYEALNDEPEVVAVDPLVAPKQPELSRVVKSTRIVDNLSAEERQLSRIDVLARQFKAQAKPRRLPVPPRKTGLSLTAPVVSIPVLDLTNLVTSARGEDPAVNDEALSTFPLSERAVDMVKSLRDVVQIRSGKTVSDMLKVKSMIMDERPGSEESWRFSNATPPVHFIIRIEKPPSVNTEQNIRDSIRYVFRELAIVLDGIFVYKYPGPSNCSVFVSFEHERDREIALRRCALLGMSARESHKRELASVHVTYQARFLGHRKDVVPPRSAPHTHRIRNERSGRTPAGGSVRPYTAPALAGPKGALNL